jgi:hypothetical protein
MGRLWVPPKVAPDLVDDRLREQAEISQMVDRFRGVLDRFNRELRAIDSYSELVFMPPKQSVADVGAIPGRYHYVRHNPGAPPTLLPWQQTSEGRFFLGFGEGLFAEPNGLFFEELKKMDMWNASVGHERRKREELAQQAADRQKERERAEIREEFRDRYNAAFRTSVSMTSAAPWSQNVQGRRGR